MILRLKDLELKLYVGDLLWEKTHLQKIFVDLEIRLSQRQRPPDYWAISKGLVNKFSNKHYEWVEDCALAMRGYLKKQFNIRGRLIVSKLPRVAQSPKVFQVDIDL